MSLTETIAESNSTKAISPIVAGRDNLLVCNLDYQVTSKVFWNDGPLRLLKLCFTEDKFVGYE